MRTKEKHPPLEILLKDSHIVQWDCWCYHWNVFFNVITAVQYSSGAVPQHMIFHMGFSGLLVHAIPGMQLYGSATISYNALHALSSWVAPGANCSANHFYACSFKWASVSCSWC